MTPSPGNSGDEVEMPDLSNMSPEEMMAWLESLAKRQGANPEELTTSADLDIPEPPPDVVIDEPGYTEYDPKLGRPKTKEEVEAERAAAQAAAAAAPSSLPEMQPEETPAAEVTATPEPVAEQPTIPGSAEAEVGLTPEMMQDPLAWLESLAKRQGAKEEELTTAANLEVPPPPPDAVIDEPGYTEYDPKLGRPKTKEEVEAEKAEALAEPSPAEEATRPAQPPEPTAQTLGEEAPPKEEIPAGLPSWLLQAAPKPEAELPPIDELPPAEPTTLPRWLAEAQAEAVPEAEAPAFEEAPPAGELGLPEEIEKAPPGEEIAPAEPGELPGRLREQVPEEMAPTPISKPEQPPSEAQLPPEAIEDSWIEAFEFEQQMKSAAEARTGAPETVAEPETPSEPVLPEVPEASATEEVPDWLSSISEEPPAAQAEGIPDWLKSIAPSEAATGAPTETPTVEPPPVEPAPQPEVTDEDLSWLDAIVEESEAEEPLEDWMVQALKEQETETPEVPLPTVEEAPAPAPEETVASDVGPYLAEEAAEWVREMVEAPLTPVAEIADAQDEAPVGQPVEEAAKAPVAEEPMPSVQRGRVEETPGGDHTARLESARRLIADGESDSALSEYERLIEESALLEEVAADLENAIAQRPDDWNALRLLGDAYMRLGRLQDALDAYQSALDRL